MPIVRIRAASGARVGILEIDPTGHRLVYVRHLSAAAGDGCVVFGPSDVIDQEDFRVHLSSERVHPVAVRGRSRREALADAMDRGVELGVSHLVIPDGDHYVLPLIALIAGRRTRRRPLPAAIRVVLLRSSTLGGPEPATPAMVVKPVGVAVLRRLRGVEVHFLTDALGVVDRRRGFPGVRAVRDPVGAEERSPEPPAWLPPASGDRVLVGLLGVISARKNLPLLLEVLLVDSGLTLVVAGRLDADVAAVLRADPRAEDLREDGRLVVVDRLLDRGEFSAALAGIDVVAVLHDNDAPSGILAEACLRGTPAVVPTGGWLARVVELSGIGRATELTPAAVAVALRSTHEGREAHETAIRRVHHRLGTEDFTSTLLVQG